jgi:hypothetical protein
MSVPLHSREWWRRLRLDLRRAAQLVFLLRRGIHAAAAMERQFAA